MRRAAVLVLAPALALVTACSDSPPDVSAHAARYEQFPVVPGAEKRSEETYEIDSDGRPTGRYGLRVVYELPANATAAEVMTFLRENIPEGWTEPTDETCARQFQAFPMPPAQTIPEDIVLLFRESQLTVYAPGEDGAPGQDIDGFTFSLSREGERKLLTLGGVGTNCGVFQPDTRADEFDNGPRPIPVIPTVPPPP